MTPILFAKALLAALNLPVSESNVAALVAIQKQEGGHQLNRAWFNPLNTMRSMPGAQEAGLQVKGIKAYSSWDEGIAATALTLGQGNMRPIVTSLSRSAPPEETLAVFAASPWGWYEYKNGVRVPHSYPGATALVRSPEALARYGSTPYRDAPVPKESPKQEPSGQQRPSQCGPWRDLEVPRSTVARKSLATGAVVALVGGAVVIAGILLFSRPLDPWTTRRGGW